MKTDQPHGAPSPDCSELGAMPKLDVVGIGYCVYDILALVSSMPVFDDVEPAHITDLVHDGGGQVGTALTTLSRLGARTGYLGILGDDREGYWLRDLFLEEGVDISRLRFGPGVGTNVCVILVDEATAGRAFLCHQRAPNDGLVLTAADSRYIQSASVLHLDGQFMSSAIQGAQWAKEAGVQVCLDANHPRPGLEDLLPLVDWLVVAQSFPSSYTGNAHPDTAAKLLLDLGVKVLAVTGGERGCHVWTRSEHLAIAAHRVVATDTTGAGDAFHGAFIYGMLQGWSLRQVAMFANTVAAINCQTLGGRRGLPTLGQALEVMGR